MIRPRVLIYGSLLAALAFFFTYSLKMRTLHEASVFHSSKDALYVDLGEGTLVNHLEIHIENKSSSNESYFFKVVDRPEVSLVVPVNPFPVPSGSSQSIPVFAHFPAAILKNGKVPITLGCEGSSGFQRELHLELIGPG